MTQHEAAWRKFFSSKGGNVAIITGVALPVLVGFVGIGIESGYWYYEQRRLQASADLAAYAGAVKARGGETDLIVPTAEQEAALHGFNPQAGTIAVNWPPLAGAFANQRSVEVLLEQQYPRTFSSVFVDAPVTMAVRAVATYDEPGPACIIALHETRSGALLFAGNANARFTGCDLMSNSLAEDAIIIQGSVEVTTSCINSAGGIYNNAQLVLDGCFEPRTNMPRVPNPYAHLKPPAIPDSCSPSPPGGPGPKPPLSPGKFCGGLTLHGNVTLEPGEYIISGGELRINANAQVIGEGVTFYLTDGATVGMNGGARIDLAAPSGGDYAGVLFFSDELTGGEAILNGTADSSLRGAVYFPGHNVAMLGDFKGSDGCTRIVALTIEVRGNPDFHTDCTGVPMGPVRAPGAVRLVE